MGVVWKAWDPELRRTVALKQLPASLAENPALRERFRREARAAARLRHENIVPVHDVGEVDGVPFLTMELLGGSTLASLLRDVHSGPAGEFAPPGSRRREAIAALAQVAEAVDHAHAQGILHRDLKPANVLFDASGRPHVADFGLAREVSPDPNALGPGITTTGAVLGTPGYMSPEQARGDGSVPDTRTDVWSLGAILYETIAGAPPFADAGEVWAQIRAVQRRDPPPPRGRDPRVPVDLEAVCLKALDRDPSRRFARTSEFADELRRWLRGDPLATRPPTAVERARRWGSRHRASLATAAAIAVLIALATAIGIRERSARLAAATTDLARIRESVHGFEDLVQSRRLAEETRIALARQPLGLLDEVLRNRPDLGPAWSWRGWAHHLLGDSAAAERDLDRGVGLSPELAETWFLRGMHALETYATLRPPPILAFQGPRVVVEPAREETEEERKWKERGLRDLNRMVSASLTDPLLLPGDAALGRALAAVFSNLRADWEEAVVLLQDSPRPLADRLRGLALLRLERFEEATTAFERAVARRPLDLEAAHGLATGRNAVALQAVQAGRDARRAFEQAIEAFEAVAKNFPDHPYIRVDGANARITYADVLRRVGLDRRPMLRQAIADLDAGLALNSQLVRARVNRGVAWSRLGEAEAEHGQDPTAAYGHAHADYRAALILDPDFLNARLNRSTVWTLQAEWEIGAGKPGRPFLERAREDLDAVLARDPFGRTARSNRAQVCKRLALEREREGLDPTPDLEAALSDGDELVRVSGGDADAHFQRGVLRFEVAESQARRRQDPRATYRAALEDFSKAGRLAPRDEGIPRHHALALWGLGSAERDRGGDPRPHYRDAIAAFDESSRLRKDPAPARLKRSLVGLLLAEAEAWSGADGVPALLEALEGLESCLRAQPGSRTLPEILCDARKRAGALYERIGRTGAAVAEYETILRDFPAEAAWAKEQIDRLRGPLPPSGEGK